MERSPDMHRYADPLELSCAGCGPVTAFVPTIVDLEDAAHRDELVEAIRSATIHQVACPGCGSTLSADAPLLLHLPGERSILIFSPAQETTAERDQEAVRSLAVRWHDQRQPSGSGHTPTLLPLPRELLPGVFVEGRLEQLQQYLRDPAAYRDPFKEIAMRFMMAISWEEAYLVVRQHPELLKLAGEEGEGTRMGLRGTAQALKRTADASAIEEGLALLHRCAQVGIEEAFAEKLGCAAEDLERLAAGSPEPVPDILKASESAERRYREAGDLEALDRAAALWEEVLFRPAPGAHETAGLGRRLRAHQRLAALEGAAGVFLQRHHARGALSDLDRAVALWTQALDEARVGAPERLRCLSNLGAAYRMQFDRTARMDDLERAISLSRQALDAAPSGSRHSADVLGGLATCIRKRFERTGQAEDLDESFALYRQVFDDAPAGSPARLNATIGLGNTLLARYQRAGQMEDLEEGIALYRQVLDATPAGSSDWPMNLMNLGEAVRARFQRTGRMKDLDESIALHRRIVDAIPPGSLHRPRLLFFLGAGLRERHQRMGRLDDLEEAISVFRRAIDAGSPDLPGWPMSLNDLGTVLRTRSEHTGRKEDLEEAIATFRRARAAIAPDAPDRCSILNNLGAALRKRYESSRELVDLQEAIALFRYNLDAAAPGSGDLPLILSTLGNALGTRYLEMRQPDDLQEAIAVYRRALDALPPRSPDRPTWLKNLALWLERRYELTEQLDDLAEANAVNREAARLKRELDAEAGVARGLMFPVEVTCATCGPVAVKVWVILDLEDIEQRPELLDAIRSGTLHKVACHQCGAELGVVDMPLLLACPGPERTLVFSPAWSSTDEQDDELAGILIEQWRKLLGEPSEDVAPRAILIPRELLPVVVDEGVEAAQARFAADRARPADPVQAALVQLVTARRVDDVYLVLREHLELIDERAEPTLLLMREHARAAGDEVTARRYEEHAAFLRRCREIGVQAAYDEFLAKLAGVIDAEQFPRSIHDGVREAEYHEERYLRSKRLEALDAAIACRERVLSDPGLDLGPSFVKATESGHTATLLFQRYRARGELSDLERAITLGRQAVEMSPPGFVNRPAFVVNLVTCLKLRYHRTARIEDLEEAIALSRQAVDACAHDSPSRAEPLGVGLGGGLLDRYELTGRMEDLEEAVGICRAAVELASTDPGAVSALGRALHLRYHRMGKPEDLDEMIAISRRARDPVAPDRPACLHNLGVGLCARYRRTRNVEDLEEAIAVHWQDLDTTPADSPEWPDSLSLSLSSLGGALFERYKRTARVEDLHDAIALLRRAVDASPLEGTGASNLGYALLTRYLRTGAMDDLQESVELLRRAVDAAVPGSLKPQIFNYLSYALRCRFQHTLEMQDLQDAIALQRRAVEATPSESPDRRMLLGNLGEWLNERHRQTGSVDDLREATVVCRLALDSADAGSPGWARSLVQLGGNLDCWYRQTRRLEDLEEAVSVYRKALEVLRPTPPSLHSPDGDGLFLCLSRLATDLHERSARTGSVDDLNEAAAAARQAMELGGARVLGAALGSAELLGLCWLKRSDWGEAASAYAEAMAIVDTLCEAQLLRSDKHSYLRSAPALYAGAAYSLARMGDVHGAVIALETGRARVLTEMLDRSRTDLEAVEKQAPELAHRYRQMLAQLRQLEGTAANGVVAQSPGESEHGRSLREQVRVARADLRGVVEAIRASPGNESFLAHPSAASLVAALEPGVPVVYLAATDVGGIALVVSSASGALEVTPLWLDSMTTDAVDRIVHGAEGRLAPESWLGAYQEQLLRQGDREVRARWHESITRTTRTLWDLAMGPVVALLRERFSGSAQAVLIPNGLLSLLPLHAAWTGDAGDTPRCALDEVSFSYAPSIRALGHARDVAGACGHTRLLVVDDPRPTSAAPLPNSRHEVEAAAAQFAGEEVTWMAGEQCRRDEVLAAIARAHVCHFSCHGMNNWNEPLQSGLLMANDEVLTVEALFALPGQRARLAVLSACETGIVGTRVPNEVVAMPSAFLQAGFAGVVASLWPVYDISASLLMGKFYELWRSERLAPAVALRRAQIWLRDLTNRDLAAYLERLVPELAPRMSRETAEALHLRALLQDPETRSFADPVYWAAFYVTGV